MNIKKKITISLFCSVVLFALFYVFAFSGLFEYIEASIYSPRVQRRYSRLLFESDAILRQFHETNRRRFATILNDPVVKTIFSFELDRDTIIRLETLFGRLNEQSSSFSFARVYDISGERLWFSTFEGDVVSASENSRIYTSIGSLESDYFTPQQIVQIEGNEEELLFDPIANRFLYRYPLRDQLNITLGVIVFYMSGMEPTVQFIRDGILNFDEQITIMPNRTILLNDNRRYGRAIRDAIEEDIEAIIDNQNGFPIIINDSENDYLAISTMVPQIGHIILLASKSDFELNNTMRITLILLTFSGVFIVLFLLFNIRQDSMIVVAERVKRFQLHVLREYLEGRERIDWQEWQNQLEEQRTNLNRRIRKGLRFVKQTKQSQIDEFIDKGWDDIINVISDHSQVGSIPEALNISQLESVLRKIIKKMPPKSQSVIQNNEGIEPTKELEALEEVTTAEVADSVEELEALEE